MEEKRSRSQWAAAAAVLAAASPIVPAVFYLCEMSPSLPWLDGGELIAVSHALGTAHPPGHALYVFAAKALSYFLPGSVAFRYSLVSLVFAVAALAAIRAMFLDVIKHVLERGNGPAPGPDPAAEVCASAGMLIVAFSPSFAFQALRAEVYSLGFLVAVLLAWSCLRMLMTDGAGAVRMLAPAVFFGGLGMGVNNFLILLLLPCAAVCAVRPVGFLVKHPRELARQAAVLPAVFLVSLLPLLYGLLRSAAHPYLDLSHVASPGEFFDVFTASVYRTFEGAGPDPGAAENLRRLWIVAGAHVLPAVLVFAAAGALLVFTRGKALLAAAAAGAAAPVLGLPLLGPLYHENPDQRAYVFHTVLFTALLAAAAARLLAELPALKRMGRKHSFSPRLAGAGIAVLLCAGQFLAECGSLRMKDSTTAAAHADMMDMIVPADALFFLSHDETSFPFLYMQAAEGRRLDVMPGLPLQFMEESTYRTVRTFWPERLPPPENMKLRPSVHVDPGPRGRVLDGIVNHAGGRWPLLWDHVSGNELEPSYLEPYYHFAIIVPPGMDEVRERWRSEGKAAELVGAFNDFFLTMHIPEADVFPLRRLANGPVALTALLYYRKGELRAAIAANTLVLGFAPDEPLAYYHRGLSFERLGMYRKALKDYKTSYLLGNRREGLLAGMLRVKEACGSK